MEWQQFGLKANPYDTGALVEGGILPIQKAFVGREKERTFLDQLLKQEEHLCLVIGGNVGVGKTSMANFQKFQWKYNREFEKLLFSSRREIEANERLLTKEHLLIEIIGSLLREIELLDSKLLKDELLKRLNAIVDITSTIDFSVGVSVMGHGANFGKGTSIEQPQHLSIAKLEGYFRDLVEFIRTTEIDGFIYSGVIVHINNFDVVLSQKGNRKKVIQFFQDIRDLLQTLHVYFFFLGPSDFFESIIRAESRVLSIFHPSPLALEPLSKKEIVQALHERMTILQSEKVQRYIQPIENEVVYKLHDVYHGDIRAIMTALKSIVSQYSGQIHGPLFLAEAMVLLGEALWERIAQAVKPLTPERIKILQYIAEHREPITQKDIAKLLKKAPTNVSGYYFGPFKNAGVIEVKETNGREKYWGLTHEYLPLYDYVDALETLRERRAHSATQRSMF